MLPQYRSAGRDEVLAWFLQVDPALGAARLTQLTRRIIARFAPDELSTDDAKHECADLIPVVLGGPSQPLDIGRRERLATKAIRAAAVLRDGGCSFPGCDRPPGFCEVHHINPWWAGGETSLINSALLCGRHHQIVHRQGYTALVRADGVHWDLTPGRMHGHQTAAA